MVQNRLIAVVEAVEPRRLLSVSVSLDAGVLNVVGGAASESVLVSTRNQLDGTSTVRSGTTSVFLDLPLLEAAASLTLSSVNSPGTPASADYQVGFPITGGQFSYQVDPFAPVSGQIDHVGTVSFNNDTITVGDFTVGFDGARATDGRSGFFVEDTASNLGILFDFGVPSAATITSNRFSVTGDLLVSPEFATLLLNLNLATVNLTGADVGNALVDGRAVRNFAPFIAVQSRNVNQSFAAGDVDSIAIDMGGGNDAVTMLNVRKDATVDLGAGKDAFVSIGGGGSLSVNGGAGNDAITLNGGSFSNALIDGGAGNDTVTAAFVRISGSASFVGGAGNDRLFSIGSDITADDVSGFERVLIV